jgi:hypothetical protein
MPNGKCRLHGGLTPAGVASPNFRHGAYSKCVPRGLKRAYERANADPELLSLRDDLALLEARVVELLKGLGQAPRRPWAKLVRAFAKVEAAAGGERDEALAALGRLLRGNADAARLYEATWRELREMSQEKARLVLAELRQLTEMGQTMTNEEVLTLFAAFLTTCRDAILDPGLYAQGPRAVLDVIQRKFDSLLADAPAEQG